MDDIGYAFNDVWTESLVDYQRRNKGNAFLTLEDLEYERNKRKVVKTVEKYAYNFSDKEWEDESILKWYPCYRNKAGGILYGHDRRTRSGRLYFKSMEDIRKAVHTVGKHDFMKYYLGIENCTENEKIK